MAKFNLKHAKQAALTAKGDQPMPAGCHRTVITQVAEVGLQPGYQGGEPKASIGIVFENAAGATICKVMPLIVNTYSNFGKVLAAVESDIDDTMALCGQSLTLEIESNGRWPKIQGYYPIEDGLSEEVAFTPATSPCYYNVETPDPETLKQLHPQLKQAISGRIRHKGV